MKFYITEETKKELEDKITEFTELVKQESFSGALVLQSHIDTYKEILEKSEVLPVEENWNFRFYYGEDGKESETFVLPHYVVGYLQNIYPNGLILNKNEKKSIKHTH